MSLVPAAAELSPTGKNTPLISCVLLCVCVSVPPHPPRPPIMARGYGSSEVRSAQACSCFLSAGVERGGFGSGAQGGRQSGGVRPKELDDYMSLLGLLFLTQLNANPQPPCGTERCFGLAGG